MYEAILCMLCGSYENTFWCYFQDIQKIQKVNFLSSALLLLFFYGTEEEEDRRSRREYIIIV